MTSSSRSWVTPRLKAGICGVAVLGTALAALVPMGTTAAGATTITVPGAPTITSISRGDHSVRINFRRPESNGGSTIFYYKAVCTSSDGGSTRTNSERSSPMRVSNLTATKTYTCTVAARNKRGFGPASAPSAAFVALPPPPPTVPGAPTITSAVAGVQSVTVTYTAPASDGGATISSYKVTCMSSDGGVTRSNDERKSPTRVTHLTAPKTYTCTVTARNRKGKGPASAPSAAVVTQLPVVPNSPGAPTVTSAVTGTHRVTVTYTAPASDGGAPITEYRTTCISSNGGVTHSVHEHSSPTKVGSLTAGRTYSCTVAARNKRGFGPESAPSGAVVVS
jgi:large repetitive protein